MRCVAVAATLFACATPGLAQTAVACDGMTDFDAIVEPWEDNSRTFANCALRLALIDMIEPAASAFHIMILHPPRDGLGVRQCTTVGQAHGVGYAAIFFEDLSARYDPASGLTFKVPVIIFLPDQNFQNSALLSISVDQSTGDIRVSQALGNE